MPAENVRPAPKKPQELNPFDGNVMSAYGTVKDTYGAAPPAIENGVVKALRSCPTM